MVSEAPYTIKARTWDSSWGGKRRHSIHAKGKGGGERTECEGPAHGSTGDIFS